jgi:TolA-binding protein
VIDRERAVQSQLPLHQRAGRLVSKLAGYAMRPQLSMAALLLLMIGSSLMFLRARPGQHSAVQVTGRGAPEADVERVVLVEPRASAAIGQSHGVFELRQSPSQRKLRSSETATREAVAPEPSSAADDEPAPTSEGDEGLAALDDGLDPFDQAVQMYRGGDYVEAERRFERLSRAGGLRAAEAALYSAQATRNASGCGPAVSRFERVRLRFPGSGPAYEAAWRAAKCLYQLGDVEAARQTYESLLQVGSHAQRARRALESLGVAPPPDEHTSPEGLRLLAAPRREASEPGEAPADAPPEEAEAAPSEREPAPSEREPAASEREPAASERSSGNAERSETSGPDAGGR